MLTAAKLAVLGVVAAGILSLVFGFSLNSGFHSTPPPANIIHTKVVTETAPKAHWPKGHGRRAHYVQSAAPVQVPNCQTSKSTSTTTTNGKIKVTHSVKKVCK